MGRGNGYRAIVTFIDKKHPEPFAVHEIVDELKLTRQYVTMVLKMLERTKDVIYVKKAFNHRHWYSKKNWDMEEAIQNYETWMLIRRAGFSA